ncbi:MAG TPA: TniQ family protein [Ensifer sp.]|jgi:hypothetical protein|uniref:TniQ family protein n=1 Tax=Ensifer sp. TaxID=1872086 RepID=UPI002E1087F5|nr:TniQ family protein [Ensifer sp.]
MPKELDIDNGEVLGASRPSLYSVAPEGEPQAPEAMLSWMFALAHAHCVNPRPFISHLIRSTPEHRLMNIGASFYLNHSLTANGMDGYAKLFVEVLGDVTGERTCSELTLLPLSHLLARKGVGLLAKQPRWCPLCLCEQLRSGRRPYRPLVWSFEFYRVCTRHKAVMLERCLACGSLQSSIPTLPSVLVCSECQASMVSLPPGKSTRLEPAQDEFEIWCAIALEDLVAKRQVLQARGSLAQFRHNVNVLVDHFSDSGKVGLCSAVGMGIYGLNHWFGKVQRPSVSVLLRLCYGVGVMPSAMFLPDVLEHVSRETPICAPVQPRQSNPFIGFQQREDIEKQLALILADPHDNRRLKAIAQQVGFTSAVLKYWFPTQCAEIVRKNRACEVRRLELRYRTDHELLKAAFQRLLASGQYPSRMRVNSELAARRISLMRPDLFHAYEEMRAAVYGR